MPFPDIDPLIETLFEPTRIWLFGKPFTSLKYDPDTMKGQQQAAAQAVAASEPGAEGSTSEFQDYRVPDAGPYGKQAEPQLPMPPPRIERTLRRLATDGIFARIYSFSYEGHYYKMPRPLLFLVSGDGRKYRPPEEIGSSQEASVVLYPVRRYRSQGLAFFGRHSRLGGRQEGSGGVPRHRGRQLPEDPARIDDRLPGRDCIPRCRGVSRGRRFPGRGRVSGGSHLPWRDGRSAPGLLASDRVRQDSFIRRHRFLFEHSIACRASHGL